MSKSKTVRRALYYTLDHEWIDFQGAVAYYKIVFAETPGFKKQGDTMATIQNASYQIPVHMPVDGKIIGINEALLSENQNLLAEEPENNGWVALIVPSQPYERKGLIQPEQYKLLMKRKF